MRSKTTTWLLTALIALAGGLLLGPAIAVEPDRGGTDIRLQQLLQSVSGDDSTLISLLESTARDPALSPLERDQLMHGFIDALRAMPPGSVGNDVLDHLANYQPQAFRPDEHRPAVPVPVHNIAAAARGLENAWRTQEAAYAGAVLLAQSPAALVQAYALHQEPSIRRGLLLALDGATHGQLETIGFMALSAIGQEPALASLAGEAAVRTGDTRALEQLLRTGTGSALTHTLRASRERLSPNQVERLLNSAVEQAQPEVAAVAIAELSPALSTRSTTNQRLFGLLGDPHLGAAAALALAARPGDTIITQLAEMARGGESSSLAAKRAALALDLIAVQAGAGRQP